MPKRRKCVSCKERGKDVDACPNNGYYCYFCMQYEMNVAYIRHNQQPAKTNKPVQQTLF
jgi:hypothetical protein